MTTTAVERSLEPSPERSDEGSTRAVDVAAGVDASYRTATIADGFPHLATDLDRALDAADGAVHRSSAPRALLVAPTVPRLLRFAAEEWALLALLWGALSVAPLWAAPVLIVLIAGRFHAFGVILHDAAHMPLRGKSLGVHVLEVLCGYPLGTTLDAMRYHHLRHHRDAGMATDPYFKPDVDGRPLLFALLSLRGVVLLPFWMVRGPFGLLAVIVPGLRNAYGRIFLQDREREDLTDSKEVLACARAEAGMVVFHALLITAFTLWPQALLLGVLLPGTLTGIVAARRLLVEHRYHHVTDRRAETIFRMTNDHGLRLLDALLLAPRNIGYHVVHHVHPQVCLSALPALRAWYVATYPTYPAPR